LLAFKGKCFNCGKYGQKSPDCKEPTRKRNNLGHKLGLKQNLRANVSTVKSRDTKGMIAGRKKKTKISAQEDRRSRVEKQEQQQLMEIFASSYFA
jgi:hypothetical protein